MSQDLSPSEPRRSGAARVLLTIGVVVGVLMVAWAALLLVDRALSETRTDLESYDPVGQVELVADGDVTVRADDDATDVSVEVVSRGGLATPEYTVATGDGSLVLENICPDRVWWSWTCAGELHAVVPADTVVTVHTANGEVRAEGPTGAVELQTSNGDVVATDLGGSLEARTSNGEIDATRVGGDVDVQSSNGRIGVVDAAGGVVARSSNGDVELRDVGGDAEARTSNGGIDVSGAAGDVVARTSNGDVTVVGDGEPVALTIETSNGEQVIEAPTDPGASRTVEIHSSNGDVAYRAP
ncbi:DUF4097 family beta strand repeat-containing protein [Isoptericola sediminis]|uniref:DUF4097 family beta strand repeat protein n=1 Tax=Isoptericola sediminis TaxID=2733572 RepID=A0A849K5P5_9MICO|nr:DUF4097 family beta strand repeat-containing protein [Isoptericola sediminis]NNU26457.1 DUF4097 family beta strand repeat protein [Isoptericola sediminis]